MMTKFFKVSAVFFLWTVLFSAFAAEPVRVLLEPATRRPVRYSALPNDTRKVMIPVRYQIKPGELRGVWVATISNLDFPKATAPAHFQRAYTDLMIRIRRAGFNAVFFQIRPSCDAFYNSSFQPFSRFLCGREGYGFPNFDLLGFMIAEAHRYGLQFHAWLNPYRVAGFTRLPKWQYLSTLSPRNFARQNPDYVLAVPVKGGLTLLLDPGQPAVRSHLLATVREIIRKYNPDSIHFDDYFYPYDFKGNADAAVIGAAAEEIGDVGNALRREARHAFHGKHLLLDNLRDDIGGDADAARAFQRRIQHKSRLLLHLGGLRRRFRHFILSHVSVLHSWIA